MTQDISTRMVDWITIEVDLSKLPQEVFDYVNDHLEDRLLNPTEFMAMVEEAENSVDYKLKTITFADPIINLIQKIAEEKQADMECKSEREETKT